MTTNIVDVDEVYLDSIIDRLTSMKVELDDDPILFGPKRLRSKIAECRHHLDTCMSIFLQLSSDQRRMTRMSHRLDMDYKLKFENLLTNDPDVRSQRSIKDREAVASVKLSEIRQNILVVEASVKDIGSLLTIVNKKKDDLKDVQAQLRHQIKLCLEEIQSLNGNWGSHRPGDAPPLDISNRPAPPKDLVLSDFEEDDDGLSDLDRYVKTQELPSYQSVSETETAPLQSVVDAMEVITPAKAPPPEPEVVTPETKVTPETDEEDSVTSDDFDDFFSKFTEEDIPEPGTKAIHSSTVPQDFNIDDILGDLV